MSCTILKATRGSQFVLPITAEQPGFSWAGVRVRVQFRESLDATDAIVTFDSAGGDVGTTVLATELTAGVYTIVLTAEGGVTMLWPLEGMVGDVQLSRDTPAFGPVASPQIAIEVSQPVTL